MFNFYENIVFGRIVKSKHIFGDKIILVFMSNDYIPELWNVYSFYVVIMWVQNF